jgi:hypothetical protein
MAGENGDQLRQAAYRNGHSDDPPCCKESTDRVAGDESRVWSLNDGVLRR